MGTIAREKQSALQSTEKLIKNEEATVHVQGTDSNLKITVDYARMVARFAYVWAWPMVNIYNRRLAFKKAPKSGLMNGVLPFGPLNTLSMLHDYIAPEQRWVACPNQDVVYGAGIAALDETPVVVQLPDFGDRFWVCQAVDLSTDSFIQLGKMYDTKPGFYLLVGPEWKGTVPNGITKMFRSNTGTTLIAPRLFMDDTAEDRKAIQSVISGIDIYPLSEFDGKMKQHDWTKQPTLKSPTDDSGAGETKWVFPEKFFDELPMVLNGVKPLPGEEALYAQVLMLIEAAKKDPAIKKVIVDEVTKTEEEVVAPLLQFRNWGVQLPYHWSKVNNGSAFGTDYFARTAVARSNILVNTPNETQYFYQDLDSSGERLNGANRYSVTFLKDQTPPVKGFWSITLYDEHHFFVPNDIKRYSLGTKNKTLKTNSDGSLTIYVQSDPPVEEQKPNWLPAPKDADFSLFIRGYWPKEELLNGKWTPPAVEKVK